MPESTVYSTFIDSGAQVTSGIDVTGFVEGASVLPSIPQELDPSLLSPESMWHLDNYMPWFSGFSDLQILGILFLILIWTLTIFWVLRDAIARSNSGWYQFFSALLVMVLSPLVGLPLYLAFRPLVYKWERGYWREAMTKGVVICPHCESLVDEQHNACVFCGESLKTTCKECDHKFYRGYAYCPECWAPNLS